MAFQSYARSSIDNLRSSETIQIMNTRESSTTSTSLSDAQAVLDHVVAGTKIDPQLARRVRERAEMIRQQILANYGLQEIGVNSFANCAASFPKHEIRHRLVGGIQMGCTRALSYRDRPRLDTRGAPKTHP